MKVIAIAGNIGKDAATREAAGSSVTSWSVAVEERAGKGEKRTLWFDVSMWGQRGAAIAPYVRKGSKIAVSGEMSTREHEGKTYLTLRAENVTLLGDGGRQEPASEPATGSRAQASKSRDLDDEIPFAPEWR